MRIAAAILLLTAALFAAPLHWTPASFRGLTLGSAHRAEAIRLLGPPDAATQHQRRRRADLQGAGRPQGRPRRQPRPLRRCHGDQGIVPRRHPASRCTRSWGRMRGPHISRWPGAPATFSIAIPPEPSNSRSIRRAASCCGPTSSATTSRPSSTLLTSPEPAALQPAFSGAKTFLAGFRCTTLFAEVCLARPHFFPCLLLLCLLCVLGCKSQKTAASERRFPIEGAWSPPMPPPTPLRSTITRSPDT